MSQSIPNEFSPSFNSHFDWKCQPAADALLRQLVADFCGDCAMAQSVRSRMLNETGTRLFDWLDHLAVDESTRSNGQSFEVLLQERGYELESSNLDGRRYVHHEGLFVPFWLTNQRRRRLTVRVESVDDFLAAFRLENKTIEGPPLARLRKVLIDTEDDCEFWVCERHGFEGWSLSADESELRLASIQHFQNFKLRPRAFENGADGFSVAAELIRSAIDDLGVDWTCDLFFAAERDYWQRRNLAARVQKTRQDRLGLGWANHDHHTYRSSRQNFSNLIAIFELLGFHCRERFYAGEQAGWGAQVLEQSNCQIVIFADVDMSPAELAGDFSHNGLSESSELGTVGLWCQLHGEAFLAAGMHHLECTFDFDAAREQLAASGIKSMAPFTDYGYLRQAFTTGEIWPVDPQRTQAAVSKGWLSQTQADKFLAEGSIGSHLEILERNEGFKGFNQSGVSDIIRKTDPRNMASNHDS